MVKTNSYKDPRAKGEPRTSARTALPGADQGSQQARGAPITTVFRLGKFTVIFPSQIPETPERDMQVSTPRQETEDSVALTEGVGQDGSEERLVPWASRARQELEHVLAYPIFAENEGYEQEPDKWSDNSAQSPSKEIEDVLAYAMSDAQEGYDEQSNGCAPSARQENRGYGRVPDI
jgi:hypothetical protein